MRGSKWTLNDVLCRIYSHCFCGEDFYSLKTLFSMTEKAIIVLFSAKRLGTFGKLEKLVSWCALLSSPHPFHNLIGAFLSHPSSLFLAGADVELDTGPSDPSVAAKTRAISASALAATLIGVGGYLACRQGVADWDSILHGRTEVRCWDCDDGGRQQAEQCKGEFHVDFFKGERDGWIDGFAEVTVKDCCQNEFRVFVAGGGYLWFLESLSFLSCAAEPLVFDALSDSRSEDGTYLCLLLPRRTTQHLVPISLKIYSILVNVSRALILVTV